MRRQRRPPQPGAAVRGLRQAGAFRDLGRRARLPRRPAWADARAAEHRLPTVRRGTTAGVRLATTSATPTAPVAAAASSVRGAVLRLRLRRLPVRRRARRGRRRPHQLRRDARPHAARVLDRLLREAKPLPVPTPARTLDDADTDGDGVRDGADDQDHDDVPNLMELSRMARLRQACDERADGHDARPTAAARLRADEDLDPQTPRHPNATARSARSTRAIRPRSRTCDRASRSAPRRPRTGGRCSSHSRRRSRGPPTGGPRSFGLKPPRLPITLAPRRLSCPRSWAWRAALAWTA